MAIEKLLGGFGKFVSEPERIVTNIVQEPEDFKKQREFLQASVAAWLRGPRYQAMREGQRYYENLNDIRQRKRTVIGRNGEMIEAEYLANNRLSHSFMRKLTKQKVGYLLSKPFSVTSDNELFQATIDEYLTKDFYRKFKNCGQDAVVAGLGWLQAYYSEEGDLRFKRIPPTEVIPFWEDIDHTVLEAVIRVFDTVEFDGSNQKVIKHVKYFTKEGVFNYLQTDSGLVPDESSPMEFSFTISRSTPLEEDTEEGASVEHYMWERIPFIPLKYNSEEDSLLKYIKDLIDDYDLRTSDASNVIQDEPDRIKVIKDYDGTDKGEFVYNLARYRTLFLRGSGSVDTLDTSISTEAIENHLNRLRKDIYEFGGGVDTQNKDLGNASGVALKYLYSDLDMDCTDFGNELASAIETLCWFIKQDCLLKFNQEFEDASVEVTFNTDVIINESETVSNLQNSVGILSTKTLLEQHPYVDDVEKELLQLQADQRQEALLLDRSAFEVDDV